jgi:hypothetical protein
MLSNSQARYSWTVKCIFRMTVHAWILSIFLMFLLFIWRSEVENKKTSTLSCRSAGGHADSDHVIHATGPATKPSNLNNWINYLNNTELVEFESQCSRAAVRLAPGPGARTPGAVQGGSGSPSHGPGPARA